MSRLSLLLLACGLALVVLALRPDRAPAPRQAALPPQLRDEPDTLMTNAVIDQFDADGSLQYRLRARTAAHFEATTGAAPRPETTRFEAPRVYLDDADGQPWTLRAERGRTLPAADATAGPRIRLESKVVALRSGPGAGFMRISTDSLELHPGPRYVASEQPVIIDTNAGRTTAGAFDGALSDGLLNLASRHGQRVHTLILPGLPK